MRPGALVPMVLAILLAVAAWPGATADSDAGSHAGSHAGSDADRLAAALGFLSASSDPANGTWPTWPRAMVEGLGATDLPLHAWPNANASLLFALAPAPPGDALNPAERDIAYKANVRTAYALAVAGYDPRRATGTDFVALVEAGWDGLQWGDNRYVNDDALAVLALRASGAPPDDERLQAAARNIIGQQRSGGGFAYGPASPTDVDFTGMALTALHAVDVLPPEVASTARDFILSHRDADTGGFASGSFSGVNCQSTVWAVHGLAVLGDPIDAAGMAFLRNLQAPDGGFRTEPTRHASNAWCTAEVIPLLAGRPQPWPGYASAALTVPSTAPVATPFAMQVRGPFTAAAWRVGDAPLSPKNPSTEAIAMNPGEHRVDVVARGDDAIWRGHATITITNAAPVAAQVTPITVDRVTPWTWRPPMHDPEGEALAWTWSGPGKQSANGTVTWHPNRLGTFAGTATATDPHGAAAQMEVTLHVVNHAPAIANATARVAANGTVALWGNATDADGPAPRFTWQVGRLAAAGSPAWLELPPGPHEVTARAIDADGASATRALSITVPERDGPTIATDTTADAAAPVPNDNEGGPYHATAAPASIDAPASVKAGEPVRLRLPAAVTDTEVRWLWGDDDTPATGAAAGRVAEHTWLEPGVYQVRAVRLDDATDVLATARIVVLDAQAAPVATAGDERATPGQGIAASLGTALMVALARRAKRPAPA